MKKIALLLLIVIYINSAFAQAPQLVKDINPGAGSISVSEAISFNGELIFNLATIANPPLYSHNQLWGSYGTNAGTFMIKAFRQGTEVMNFQEMNGKLYFIADDSIHGNELWVTDGSITGTQLVKDINPNDGSIPRNCISKILFAMNNKLYFPANDGIHGVELWSSDGTDSGTQMVKDINPDSSSIDTVYYGHYVSSEYNYAVVNNQFFFMANDGADGFQLWVTDGTNAGTQMLTADPSGFGGDGFMPFKNKLFFFGNTTSSTGLWQSAGTPGSTHGTTDVVIPLEGDFAVLSNNLFFAGYNSITHRAEGLWETDGTAIGTINILDSIMPYTASYWFLNNNLKFLDFTVTNNNLYYISDNALWKSDGTKTGSGMLYRPVTTIQNMSQLIAANNKLYFRAYSTYSGHRNSELFISDGSDSGTKIIDYPGDNGSGNSSLRHSPLTQVGNTLFYVNDYDNTIGAELYKLDIPVSVNNISKAENNVEMWPNPAKKSLYLTAPNPPKGETYFVTVANMVGQIVLSQQYNNTEKMQIDVSSFAAGVYFIKLNGVFAGKLVKE